MGLAAAGVVVFKLVSHGADNIITNIFKHSDDIVKHSDDIIPFHKKVFYESDKFIEIAFITADVTSGNDNDSTHENSDDVLKKLNALHAYNEKITSDDIIAQTYPDVKQIKQFEDIDHLPSNGYDFVVDALLGTGTSGAAKGVFIDLVIGCKL